MTKTILLATTAALAFAAAAPAFAETAPTAPRQTAEASDQGVLVFAPDFFRDARPNTAPGHGQPRARLLGQRRRRGSGF